MRLREQVTRERLSITAIILIGGVAIGAIRSVDGSNDYNKRNKHAPRETVPQVLEAGAADLGKMIYEEASSHPNEVVPDTGDSQITPIRHARIIKLSLNGGRLTAAAGFRNGPVGTERPYEIIITDFDPSIGKTDGITHISHDQVIQARAPEMWSAEFADAESNIETTYNNKTPADNLVSAKEIVGNAEQILKAAFDS